jgi:hypothetical protein
MLSSVACEGGMIVSAPDDNLTGVWQCDDGGTYYVRDLFSNFWWFGRSADGGATWSNVFFGQAAAAPKPRRISGLWADVPMGVVQGSGTMEILIENENSFRRTDGTGTFGGSHWFR